MQDSAAGSWKHSEEVDQVGKVICQGLPIPSNFADLAAVR